MTLSSQLTLSSGNILGADGWKFNLSEFNNDPDYIPAAVMLLIIDNEFVQGCWQCMHALLSMQCKQSALHYKSICFPSYQSHHLYK